MKQGDTECEEAREQYIDTAVAHNKYESESSLGGLSRLRAFISSRFRGAHTRFFRTKFRWDLTDETTPFDIIIMTDIRTAIQVAFSFKIGTIADKEEDLYEEYRYSAGVGFRLVINSIVYRLDVAYGNEGFNYCVFFDYPWTFS